MNEILIQKSNELIDPQAQFLVDFLNELGLPSNNIVADADQRKKISSNLVGLIQSLPDDVKKDARYLSKFAIGAGFGLFDYSVNAVWNEVVVNLRKKAVIYGLDIVFDAAVGGSKAREHYKTEDDLSSLKDSSLLAACRKLELISDTTYKKLKHILDMRNDIGISHPTNYSIGAFELLGYLEVCVNDVLKDNPTEAALQVQSFIKNLKSATNVLDKTAISSFEQKIMQLPTHLCGNLLRSVFGIFVSEQADTNVRKNISLIAPHLWSACLDDDKYKLGIALEGYNVNLFQEKHELGKQFFDLVKGHKYQSISERVIIVNELITELLEKHDGYDNFHHESPVAAQIYSYMPDNNSVLQPLASRLYKSILICRLGRGNVSYCEGVSLGAKKYYDSILSYAGDNYSPAILAALSHYEVRSQLASPQCRKHLKAILEIVKKSVVNGRILECIDFLLVEIDTDPNCVDSKHFRDLVAAVS